MNTSETKGNWSEQKGRLKQKFVRLMKDDLMLTEGKKDEILRQLQLKLGITKEECDKIIAAL